MVDYDSVLGNRIVFQSLDQLERDKLRHLIENLPVSSHCMLEFPTNTEEIKPDFSIDFKSPKLVPSGLDSFCQHLFDLWKSDERFARYIADGWIEFDSIGKKYSHSTFFTVKNFNHRKLDEIRYFFEKSVSLQKKKTFKVFEVFGKISSDNIVSHIGFMHNRENTPIRINIKKAKENLNELLKVLDLHIVINQGVKTLIQTADSITFTIDVFEDGIGKRLGFECFFKEQNNNYLPQKKFMDKLIQLGFASEQTANIINDWIGISEINWSLLADDHPMALLSRIKPVYFWRILNHFKIVLENGEVKVKTYLAFGYKWMD